jgi:nucleotide-binding universal stress UspA family protein
MSGEIVRTAVQMHAILLVYGTWFGTRFSHRLLSPLAEQILRRARLPLVLVRAGEQVEWRPQRILLPHDGTPTTAAAVPAASGLALRSGAELLVMHIATEFGGRPAESGTFHAPRYLDQLQHEWPSWGHEFLDRMYALGHQQTPASIPKLVLRAGEPGREILRFAEEHEIDLIVLAWSGHWAKSRAATLKTVIREAHCPVLILRADFGPEAG